VNKELSQSLPVAAMLVNKLFADNDLMRDSIYDVDRYSQSNRNISGKLMFNQEKKRKSNIRLTTNKLMLISSDLDRE
jgi:hypothetical protein